MRKSVLDDLSDISCNFSQQRAATNILLKDWLNTFSGINSFVAQKQFKSNSRQKKFKTKLYIYLTSRVDSMFVPCIALFT